MDSQPLNVATSCWFTFSPKMYAQIKDKNKWVLGYWEKEKRYFICRQEEPKWWALDDNKYFICYMNDDPDYIAKLYVPYQYTG